MINEFSNTLLVEEPLFNLNSNPEIESFDESSQSNSLDLNQLEITDEDKNSTQTMGSSTHSTALSSMIECYPHNGEIDKVIKWKKHQKFGTFIENTKIIPTKVFLMENKWQPYLVQEEKYSISDLFEHCNSKQVKLGVIIDLNRSYDYYDFSNIAVNYPEYRDVKYIKLKMDSDCPDDDFIDEVYEVLKESHLRGDGVAIHCFNGLNRTGFVIVDFLCRFFGYPVDEALEMFETARGHVVENEVLRKAIFQRFR